MSTRRSKHSPYELVKWNITHDMLSEWQYLDKEVPRNETYGCVYNTLAFTKVVPRDVAEYLTKMSNQRAIKEGTTPEDFYALMREYYNNQYDAIYHFQLLEKDLSPETWSEVYQHLHNGQGTFLWLQRKGNVAGHAVVLAKDQDALVIIDPQQGKLRKYESFDAWFSRLGVVSALFVLKTKTNKRTLKSTQRAFKRIPSMEKQSTKRRRISNTPSPYKIAKTPSAKRTKAVPAYRSPPRSKTPSKTPSKTRSKSATATATIPTRSKTRSMRPSKTRVAKFDIHECPHPSAKLEPDEISIVLLSHGGYIHPENTVASLVAGFNQDGSPHHRQVPFSKFPLNREHSGAHNEDMPASKSFTTPSNVMMYQYSHPESPLNGEHVTYIETHLRSGKCIIHDLPETYWIFIKEPSETHPQSNDPKVKILVNRINPHVVLPHTNTTNMDLEFDNSVPGFTMGYRVFGNDGLIETDNLDLTYTSLKNILYDLSTKYADKKIYVHQLSCRSGEYTDYKQQMKNVKQLMDAYHDANNQHNSSLGQYIESVLTTIKEKYTEDTMGMEIDELTRDFDKIGIRPSTFHAYSDAYMEQLIQNKYKLVWTMLSTDFNSTIYDELTGLGK